jgi:hypothetical protein
MTPVAVNNYPPNVTACTGHDPRHPSKWGGLRYRQVLIFLILSV